MADAVPATGWNYQYPNTDGTYTRIVGSSLDDLYTQVARYTLPVPNLTTLAQIVAYDAQVNAVIPQIQPQVDAYLATLNTSVQNCYQQYKPCYNIDYLEGNFFDDGIGINAG